MAGTSGYVAAFRVAAVTVHEESVTMGCGRKSEGGVDCNGADHNHCVEW